MSAIDSSGGWSSIINKHVCHICVVLYVVRMLSVFFNWRALFFNHCDVVVFGHSFLGLKTLKNTQKYIKNCLTVRLLLHPL